MDIERLELKEPAFILHLHMIPCLYAKNTFYAKYTAYDFVVLKQFGIDPDIVSTMILSIPFAVKGLLLFIDYCHSSSASRKLQNELNQIQKASIT